MLQPEERDVKWESFRDFVDRTLALQCGSPIKKFSLNCYIDVDSEISDVNRWICNAVEHGVLEMDLSIENTPGGVVLPCELFKSKTLVKLILGTQISLRSITPDVLLPSLKSLFIETIFFEYEDLCCVLLPGCPVLEELYVRHKLEGKPYCISSRTIKKPSICYDDLDLGSMSIMSFDAPSLVSLDYFDYALAEYPKVNLESLVEARLDIHYSKMIKRPDLSGFIMGIRNIETLHLSPASADVISRCVKHGLELPVFDNLVNLSFGSNNKRGWALLPYLLDQSLKLQTLTIQGLEGYTCDVYHVSVPSESVARSWL